jgi:DNA-binding GntR family transcriptional regulator
LGKNSPLNLKSLKEQVYEYLREQLHKGKMLPGSVINMEETSRKLGVSKTPLRDAILQLEMEGFVSILPRRGVMVNVLTLKDIKEYYEVIGALESAAVALSCAKINELAIQNMKKLIEDMKKAIGQDNFDLYYDKNLKFHNIYLNLCGNESLIKIVNNFKKRLYDFPRQKAFVKEWEQSSIHEHEELLKLIKQGKFHEAAHFIRDVHWSYRVQEKFISKYYTRAPQFMSKLSNV